MQPSHEIKHHPINLDELGMNPYGQPLWRVVWADSRRTKCVCRGKRYDLPRYAHGDEINAGGHWVLERWAPPEVVVGMNREQWEALLATFPNAAAEAYPERGEYELSRVFNEDAGPFCRNIDEMALLKQLHFHEWRHRNTSAAEREQNLVAAEEKKEAAADEKFDTMFEEAKEETRCLTV